MKPDSGIFYSLVVQLIAEHDATLPATHGDLGHAAFLVMIRAVQPELAQVLHDHHGRKPFTVSPLRDLPPVRNGICRLRAGDQPWLRLTVLDPQLFAAFMERLLTGPTMTIRLGEAHFQISQVLGTPGSHPWAGYTTVETLQTGASKEHRIRLVFASPTAFSLGAKGEVKRRMSVLPVPELLWGSLRGSWKAFVGQKIPFEFETWVRDYVVVREVRNWRTHIYQFRNGTQVGGNGDVVFEALDHDPDHLRTLNQLADFAFYAGVGYKTTMGMGQVRRVVSR